MKILIWTLSILITSIVVVMIKSADITLGAIPTMILYAPLFFITPKLCKKWDEHKESKEIYSKTNSNNSSIRTVSQKDKPLNPPAQTISNSYPQVTTVTNMHDLSNYYGKFVKLEIDGLDNMKTFKLRHPHLSGSVPEEVAILATPLSELWYSSMRGDICVKIEPISVIAARSYEENHYIYGILRKRPRERYVLTNAFVVSSNSHLQIIAKALKTQGLFEYTTLDDGTISVFDFISESVDHLEIPEKIDGRTVTAISARAFDENQTIKSLKIPHTVKTIECGAFCGCNNLESVYLGDGVETLDIATFDVCKALKKVYLGRSVTKLDGAFHNCHNITAFEIHPDNDHFCVIDGVLFSKDRTTLVFCPCGKTGTYIIPNGTKVIGEDAFENSDLEEIVISNTVEKLEACAFAWTAGMKKLTIPSSVVEIEYEAISAGIKEIIIEQGSYAQQYFEDFDEGEYNLTVVDKFSAIETAESTLASNSDKLFCRRCGVQLPLDSDFCFKCGTKVEK